MTKSHAYRGFAKMSESDYIDVPNKLFFSTVRLAIYANSLSGCETSDFMLGYYRPPLTPPKNPIKREKKKLAYSSEREDFIQSGEDQFACILRVTVQSYVLQFLS